jgi:oligoribonuclease NrnB/cAMP/cGMP phosphodiesterase (DHH superfamily)
MRCFYHNDADGRCAGFWVQLSVGITDLDKYNDPSMIEMSYEKKFPLDTIRPDEQIYIVDYSISPNEMRELLKITSDVTWIDHHKTAIEKYTEFEHEIRGIRYDGIAGCMLTYCYIHHMTSRGEGEIKPFDLSMIEDAPMFTKYIADWDVWKFEYGNDTRNFITAFNAYDMNPASKLWDRFLCFPDGMINSAASELIRQGETMTIYRDGWANEVCKSKGFAVDFEGYKCFALNLPNCNSEYFKSVDNGTYEILMPFSFNGDLWTISLYSKVIDVSEIAKKYGGGGHKGASGFQCKTLPFIK